MQQWIRCTRCGANNAPGQRFCNACGSPLAAGCPNCGTPIAPGSTFCPRCGMTFGAQQGGYYQPPQQPGYPPQQPGYPPQQPGYPPQQPGYPPQQPGYPPQQPGYPPQQPGYPPQQPGYPPQQPGYPPQQPGYPPQQPGYPPQQPGYPPQQPGYPPQQPGYPPQQPGYPPQQQPGYPPPPPPYGGYTPPAPRQGGGGGGKGMLVFLLVILLAGLGGFGYWAYTKDYLKIPPSLKFGSDNTTTSTTTGPKDTTPPAIKNIRTGAVALQEASILWDTDDLSSSQVEWGPKGSFGNKTDIEYDPSTGTNLGVVTHGVIIKGLVATTDYQYRVISKNKDGLETISDVNYFTTPTE